MVDAGTTDLAVSGDWTPVQNDADLIKDGGSTAPATNTIASEGDVIWSLALTAAECQCTRLAISIVDAATKAVEDNVIICNSLLSGHIEANKAILILEVNNTSVTASTTVAEFDVLSPTTTEETVADIFIGRLLLASDGTAFQELTDITDSANQNSRILLTYTAIVSTPSAGDHFVVI